MLLLSPSRWWVLSVQGLLNLVFGVFILCSPHLSSFGLVCAFVLLAASNGAIGLVLAFRERKIVEQWWINGLLGTLNTGMGLFIILFSQFGSLLSQNFLTVFIGVQALVQGSIGFGVSMEMNRVFKVRGAFLFYGVLSIAGGILILSAPYVSLMDFLVLIATYSILAGIGQGLDSLRFKRMAPRGGTR